ncbi:F-box protein at4g00755 [Phtheirospermum japonicum]|uniref:F-box protein at4g00755 n=1 Tax=Phtheirospermum japonicum TaxID=374723 RepID=A0A830C204_9LAMI|nr:F-box protein at4g00755 [Phtheirospermum japonicum]
MEDGKSFVDAFDIDLTSNILTFLSDPSDLIRAGAVSHSWRHFVIANGLCKNLWMQKVPQVAYVACADEESDGILKVSNVTSKNAASWGTLEKEHKLFSSLLQPFSKPIISPKCMLAFPVGASSTDRDPPVTIINTLTPEDCSFWSSKGHSDPNAPEYLLYRLNASISILTEVDIRAVESHWEPGYPIYSPKSVRFRMGHPKSVENVEMGICPVDQPSLDKYVWTYTSSEFPMAQISRLQKFKLPEPVCVGGVIMIELLGRTQKDATDDLFYIRLRHVRFMGQALEPAFYAEMYPSGELQLNYYPQALDSVLQSFSVEKAAVVLSELPELEIATRQERCEELCVEMAEGVLFLSDDEDN